MTSKKQFQQKIKISLKKYFDDTVVVEWPISRGATDKFIRRTTQYSPRVDVAVNTAGVFAGNHRREIENFWNERAPRELKNLLGNLEKNINPRCSLAIEVVFSGSSKHILGDITNASMMGLYGVIVPSQKMTLKVKRIFEYVKRIKDAGKAPETLFKNVLIIPQKKFTDLIS